ncbi:cell division protein FtsX [Xylanimonas oleitrophica]|uniref:Cell division protein FtsX n=1 Tax=Xylanimonas oleitrophica TaxID=2607479 RepID=A0A2W5WJ69_9MICO|nr:FtsK/SpoIIIE domain-containing protein [Xylanimonas oleitrophica]PZR51569.1 cell division protein FtsX [Xylanimonas oleitrophica]
MWRLSIEPTRDSGLAAVDVEVVAREGARVADLARALGEHLAGSPETLLAPVTDGAPWPAGLVLTQAPLRTGAVLPVMPVPASWLGRAAPRRAARARVRVVAGPDAGLEVAVDTDACTVGRGAGATVRLSDPAVSRLHARLLLVGGVVVQDEGSAHGTRVAGRPVVRAQPVAWGERVEVGRTVLEVHRGDAPLAEPDAAVLRPPRFGEALEPAELEVPAPPAAPRRQPFPWPMMLMPALLGGGMFLTSRSPFSLMFMIGFPLLMTVNHLVARRQAAKEHDAELRTWRADVEDVLARIDDAARVQRERAAQDEPDLVTVRERVAGGHPSTWVRTREDEDFLVVRAGTGPRPAVVTGQVARGGDRVQRDLAVREVEARRRLAGQPVPLVLAGQRVVAVTSADRTRADAAVRALLVRVAAAHSPTDVVLAAVLGGAGEHVETWLRWLPHTAHRVAGAPPVAVGATAGAALLDALVGQDAARGRTVCVVDEEAGVPRRVVEAVAAAGPERGVHLLWVGSDPDRVPSATDVLLDLDALRVRRRDRGGDDVLDTADTLDLAAAWHTARALTACRDESAVVPPDSALPDAVRLPDLGTDLADPDDATAVLDRWSAAAGLRAQLGAGPDGVVTVDLREDGPHGLVAGTTGSGKSELLQTLLCSLAVNNPPSRITFLLVDYKGGAAFRECADLPHTVGYITDLTPALVQRALVSLRAELAAREHLLAEHGAKDLVALERLRPDVAPPSMLICVDEFAALLAEVPEFVDGVVDVAQRGRSLGMHLLLATQRPAGVVTPQIKANTDLRIALRMASTEDSGDVIDAPDAAALSRRTPGRAWLRRTGHGTRELVQVAWVGAHEPVRDDAAAVQVRPFTVRAGAGPVPAAGQGRVHERSDLERLVLTVGEAFARSGLPAPSRPWLPALEDEVQLAGGAPGTVLVGARARDEAAVPGSAPDVHVCAPAPGTLPLGLADHPGTQDQRPLLVDYARAGHLLVHGASGSGKTELLRTVAAAATLAHDPAPAVVYGIDAAGGGLGVLDALPSVGSVVGEQQPERVQRLVRMVHRTVVERNALLARHGAADIGALADAGVVMPRVHLLVDNLPALVDQLESGGPLRRAHLDQLSAVLQDGRRCGVHVTATTPLRTGLPSALAASFGQRLVLRMTSVDDYQVLGVPQAVLDDASPAGRGLLGRTEVQVATVGAAGTPEQGRALRELAARERDRYASQPPVAVPAMPTRVPADLVPVPEADGVCVGVDADLASGVVLSLLGGPLLVTGRGGSGRTSFLLGLADAAARSTVPPRRVRLLGPAAPAHPGVEPLDEPAAVLSALEEHLAAPAPSGSAWDLVLVDDVHVWERGWERGGEDRRLVEELARLVEEGPARRTAVVLATDADEARARQHVPGPVSVARRARRAVLLGPEMADGSLVGVTVPMHTHEPLGGVGRGLLVASGSARTVQVLSPSTERESVS